MGMPGNSPLGPALFVDHVEQCCSSLVCEGHQAKPDERVVQVERKPCLPPVR